MPAPAFGSSTGSLLIGQHGRSFRKAESGQQATKIHGRVNGRKPKSQLAEIYFIHGLCF